MRCTDAASGWRDDRALPSSLPTSSPSIPSPAIFLRPSPPSPIAPSPSAAAYCVSPSMSGQQCLRRLAASAPLRPVPLLRASRAARLSTRAATRNYTAVSKAASCGLLTPASRSALPMPDRSVTLTSPQTTRTALAKLHRASLPVAGLWYACLDDANEPHTDIRRSRHRCQGATDGRIHHRGNSEAVVKT